MKRDELKAKLLREQNGCCFVCQKKEYLSSNDGKGFYGAPARIQKVNTLDHNHSHVLSDATMCPGCEQCARGMCHNYCNRMLTLLERNEHLHDGTVIAALVKRGGGPYTNGGFIAAPVGNRLAQS